MALLVSLHVNDRPIGLLNIHNLGGDWNGWCAYEVTHHDDQGQKEYAEFTHSRPDGARAELALAAALNKRAYHDPRSPFYSVSAKDLFDWTYSA